MKPITELHSWISLRQHAKSLSVFSKAFQARTLQSSNLSLDIYHKQLDETSFELLLKLAEERHLQEKIAALIRGDKINYSEQRPALHTALRGFNKLPIMVDGRNISEDILRTRETMWSISSNIRAGEWRGYTGKAIVNIVNIGIGGSDLGPRFCINALDKYTLSQLNYHFVSDIDPHSFENVVSSLNPETTLFIIASKSFTTHETLYNAKKALNFIADPKYIKKHFIAITANEAAAKQYGIQTILPIWEWIGGRYSLCSAINLISCIALGYERFSELLTGAHSMDQHLHHQPLHENLPVIMALLGLWNINFLHIPSLLLLLYAKQLEQFIPYIQQLDMESNGKSTDSKGQVINYSTGPIVWGGLGNQAQHSYYQLLCQGTHKVAADFISCNNPENKAINAICDTKIRILHQGVAAAEPNNSINGGMPINHIQLRDVTPICIGELIALYEHKIFIQGVLWNINSFDQPGVESAKRFSFNLKKATTASI